MDENWNPEPVKQLLNRSLAQLDQSTLTRLRSAREQALDHYAAHRTTLPLHAWAGEHAIWRAPGYRSYYRIGLLLLVLSLFSSIVYWQQTLDNDTSSEDIAILTGDLPIQFYID